jgi:hypothetical protein
VKQVSRQSIVKRPLLGTHHAAATMAAIAERLGGTAVAHEFLSVYLSDHLAGAQAALEILALLREDRDSDVWRRVESEIVEDRAELERLMSSTGSSQSTGRRAAAWTAEKLAELKLRVDDSSTDGCFRRLELIEALAIGIDGKQALWAALERTHESNTAVNSLDYPRLIARAQSQRHVVEGERLAAAAEAFR